MDIRREGLQMIVTFFGLTVLCFFLRAWSEIFGYISIIFILTTLLLVYFFRDPQRKVQENETLIYSPADGEVIEIAAVCEEKFFKSEAQVIRIFMTPLDVHIQRAPVKGRIDYLEYKKGKFLPANWDKASEDNEQNLIGIDGRVKVLVKQIAGVLARRIVWWVHLRQGVSQGERIGMIKLGSQVDIFVPLNVKIKVKVKERVQAGLTVIGEIK